MRYSQLYLSVEMYPELLCNFKFLKFLGGAVQGLRKHVKGAERIFKMLIICDKRERAGGRGGGGYFAFLHEYEISDPDKGFNLKSFVI